MNRILLQLLIIVTVCLVAAGALPPAGAAGATPAQAPSVRLQELRLGDGLTVSPASAAGRAALAEAGLFTAGRAAPSAIDAGASFTMAGVICAVPAAPADVTVRLQTSADGTTWSSWTEAPLERAAEAGGTPRAFIEPVWTGTARYIRVTAAAGGAASPAVLRDVRLVLLDPELDAPAPAQERAGLSTAAVASSAATPAAGPASASAALPVAAALASAAAPRIVTRRQWGADESWRSGRPDYAKVKMAFIHHTASGNDYTAAEAPAIMRAIYAYHAKSLGWSDIAYNFLVDRFGTIYEGRYGGMKKGVVGAQTLGFNTGSTGISVVGNFAADAPPAAALASLERLLAWKLKVHHIDPRGTARLTSGASEKFAYGARVTFPAIAGHRQANATECPGNILFPLLSTVRLEADGRPQPPIIALVKAAPQRFSPNGDGELDKASVSLSLTKKASWTVELRDAHGKRLGSYSGEGAYDEVSWPGTDADGRKYGDGVYVAVVNASSALGKAAPKTVRVTIDTVAPGLSDVDASPGAFSPNGDGSDDSVRVRYVPAELCSVRVAIVDADGKVRRRLGDWRSQSKGAHSADWDGKVSDGGKPVAGAEGEYRFVVECRDAAGNTSHKSVGITLDRTLGFPTATPETLSPNGDGKSDSTALGFKLTRSAEVRIAVKVDGKTVRVLEPRHAGRGTSDGRLERRDRRRRAARERSPELRRDGEVDPGHDVGHRDADRRPVQTEAHRAGGQVGLVGQVRRALLFRAGSVQRQGEPLVCDHRRRGHHSGLGVARLGVHGQGCHVDLEAAGARRLHGDVDGDRPRREPRAGARRDRGHRPLA